MPASSLPRLSMSEIADRILDYWMHGDATLQGRIAFDLDPGRILTVDLGGLKSNAAATARIALGEWTAVSGLDFVEVAAHAQITFKTDEPGSWASPSYSPDGVIERAVVNIGDVWWNDVPAGDSGFVQTYIHEIGHALGLGHPGNYDGYGVRYETHAEHQNDTKLTSVMSYFFASEDVGLAMEAVGAPAVTPMAADIAAIQKLYGDHAIRSGDTVYGLGSTAGGTLDLFPAIDGMVTIEDHGGRDVIDFSHDRNAQVVDLSEGGISSVWGRSANLVLAPGARIEEFRAGSGLDVVRGGAHAQTILGGAGDDRLTGGSGDDILDGGAGTDMLQGGAGDDLLVDGEHHFFQGDWGQDVIRGFEGDNEVFVDLSAGQRFVGAVVEGADTLLSFSHGAGIHLEDYRLDASKLEASASSMTFVARDVRHVDVPMSSTADPHPTAPPTTAPNPPTATSGDDRIKGTDGEDRILGLDGDDRIDGRGGDDRIDGDAGRDRLKGGDGDDKLRGGDGEDKLKGGRGDDVLIGGDGDDKLYSDAGRDKMKGGDGADRFVFKKGLDADKILDFDPSEGDRIDLRKIDSVRHWNDLSRNHMEHDGDDIVLDLRGGDTITVRKVADLTEDAFIL